MSTTTKELQGVQSELDVYERMFNETGSHEDRQKWLNAIEQKGSIDDAMYATFQAHDRSVQAKRADLLDGLHTSAESFDGKWYYLKQAMQAVRDNIANRQRQQVRHNQFFQANNEQRDQMNLQRLQDLLARNLPPALRASLEERYRNLGGGAGRAGDGERR